MDRTEEERAALQVAEDMETVAMLCLSWARRLKGSRERAERGLRLELRALARGVMQLRGHALGEPLCACEHQKLCGAVHHLMVKTGVQGMPVAELQKRAGQEQEADEA